MIMNNTKNIVPHKFGTICTTMNESDLPQPTGGRQFLCQDGLALLQELCQTGVRGHYFHDDIECQH